jgi:hypothetical protein
MAPLGPRNVYALVMRIKSRKQGSLPLGEIPAAWATRILVGCSTGFASG